MESESLVGTDLATDVSRRTDKTSYSIPEDGSPITISTQKLGISREGLLGHGRQKSQTSLLIEYFEAGKSGDKTRARPSVRVKVTPSAARRSKNGSDAVQITSIGKDRKPSYTRRISLGNKTENVGPVEGTEVSRSSESNISGRPPVEIELLNPNGSDLSNSRNSRDLGYLQNASDISSMPPDSLLETTTGTVAPQQRSRSRSLERQDVTTTEHLNAPARTRSRSLSRERITQKVMEKLAAKPLESSSKHRRNRDGAVEYEPETKPTKEKRRRSSRTYSETVSPESSLLSSNVAPSQTSYRSGTSKVSLNNPKLLEMVEDTVRRLILPEISQMKSEQKANRNLRDFDDGRRTSTIDRDSYSEDLGRRLSKSSSTPNIASKPKVVLNRYGDDPGEILSRGDSERRPHRSSRESTPLAERSHNRDRRSSKDSIVEEETTTKKSKDGHHLRDAAAGGIVGGILTAAALRHHDSQGSVNREKRKKRSKSQSRGSRSRSASIAETEETYRKDDTRKEDIPPMPFGGHNDSEITRDSILSAATERPVSRSSRDIHTPIREVSRGAIGEIRSPGTFTPARTPITATRNLGSSQSDRSMYESTHQSPNSANSISEKAKLAALAAAGLGGVALGHHLGQEHAANTKTDQNGSPRSRRGLSPVHSVSSARDDYRDPLIPQALRPRSKESLTSTAIADNRRYRDVSPLSTLGGNQYASQRSPVVTGADSFAARTQERDARPESDLLYEANTPNGDEVDDWFRNQHEENERYRHSMAETSGKDSLDDKRMTGYTDESYADSTGDGAGLEQNMRGLGANPEYVHTPVAVESVVASLLDPSNISSVQSSQDSASKSESALYQSRMAENVRELSQPSPARHENEAIHERDSSPSKDRWTALRDHAQALSQQTSKERGVVNSPRQSEARSFEGRRSFKGSTPVRMGASGMPLADDPMPEIGHGLDEDSDITTNPSDIQGPSGARPRDASLSSDSISLSKGASSPNKGNLTERRSGHSGEAALLGAGAGAGAALAANHLLHGRKGSHSQGSISQRASVEDEDSDERGITPDLRHAQAVYLNKSASPTSPVQYGDEGYASAAHARSTGAQTPTASVKDERGVSADDMAAYDAMMSGDDDPFVGIRHTRHLSANSHGMASPLYDSATGKGIDRIQSHDIVALMDHLTVRDGQRNARDTEILITLVRSAAEMRTGFEEMKKFIAQQNRINMNNTDRDADVTVQKILGGPRPQPNSAPRSLRSSYDEEDAPVKRKNMFKRALKGLSMRGNNDLGKIEQMLNQLLDDVEGLKDSQGLNNAPISPQISRDTKDTRDSRESFDSRESMDSYERLRAAPDPGYEPEGRAGSTSTPNQSGLLVTSPRGEKQMFHSGYDGRRDSINRVSTVMEGDEDEQSVLEPHEARVLDQGYNDHDRYHSPSLQDPRRNSAGYTGTPTQRAIPFDGERSIENTPEKQRKHKSNNSSIFNKAKFSRWSKTTTSSVPENDYDARRESQDTRRESQDQKRYSDASRSGDSLVRKGAFYDDDEDYSLQSDDRLRSTQSLAREQAGGGKEQAMDTRSLRSGHSRLTRTPSPLIPDEGSAIHRRSIDEQYAAPSPKLMLPQDDEDFDDPKYQAHRNSLLLQHPQPRQGPTHRHQTNLESQAHDFGDRDNHTELGTDSDLSQKTVESDFDPAQWGSAPSLSLARSNKLSGVSQQSPVQSPTGYGASSRRQRDDGPLMPSTKASAPEPAQALNPPQPSFNRMYYSSPLGSGHLLEPIEEVRYSLETDRGHVSR